MTAPPAVAVIVGDSHCAGAFGVELERLLLQADPSAHVYRATQEGAGVGPWIARLASWTPPEPVKLFIVALGSNDYHLDPAAWAERVGRLAAVVEASSPQAALVWIGPPVIRGGDTDWMRWALDQTLSDRWTVIDSIPLTAGLPQDAARIHYPGAAGKTWAARVMEQLQRIGQGEGEGEGRSAAWWAGTVVGLGLTAALVAARVLKRARRATR